jgi:hypothetical protein
MHDIWKKKQKVTYPDFSEFVKENHPLETTLHIPKHTFSRLLGYCNILIIPLFSLE